nr:hypothetical protein [Tanacetum cinerariifolium]
MTKDEAGNEVEVPPVTAQQILGRTRERKAKCTLIMAIPNEHLARFYGIKDAKTLWAAIGGVSTEDANKKFQRSLPSAWSNISLIMRNKPNINNLDIDDLFNNLKVYEANIKGSFGSSSNLQNVAFVSTEGTSSTNELNTAYSVSTATGHSSQKTRRKLEFNRKEPVGFDKTKVECFNCHRRWHFARDCRIAKNSENRSRDAGNTGYRGRNNGKRPAREEDEKALVVQDGLGSYDWSYQVEEEATDFALMHEKLKKANLEIVGYHYGLESIEGQLCVHQQNEVVHEKKIGVQEYDVKEKSNFLKYTQKQLDEALREKEDLKAKLENQFNRKEVLDIKEEGVTETVFDNRLSDEKNSLANDRFKKGEGYHAVPPPLTGNYMPPKSDLSFAGLDGSIYKFKISETVTSLTKDEKDALETSIAFIEKTKEVRTSAPLIQD